MLRNERVTINNVHRVDLYRHQVSPIEITLTGLFPETKLLPLNRKSFAQSWVFPNIHVQYITTVELRTERVTINNVHRVDRYRNQVTPIEITHWPLPRHQVIAPQLLTLLPHPHTEL